MQVGNKDVLNCYYAHAEDSLQVCYDGFLRPLLAGFQLYLQAWQAQMGLPSNWDWSCVS